MTVFVVDDDLSVRQSLRRLLSSEGYDVVLCGSAAEFLAVTERPRPSCLVTDLRMPGTTGLDLQDALRRSGRELPIIVSSGQADAATTFANCTALHRVYKYGVAKSKTAANKQYKTGHYRPKVAPAVYSANAKSDADKDGTACEVTR